MAIDLVEVGAGGGSHVWIDPAVSLQVGPSSAGAVPGPVCYDIGGTEPTVTDANVVLGYLNSEYLVGGALKINAEKARDVFAKKIAEPLGLSVEHAAYGTHKIAASNMIRAIKELQVYLDDRVKHRIRFWVLQEAMKVPVSFALRDVLARWCGKAAMITPPIPDL